MVLSEEQEDEKRALISQALRAILQKQAPVSRSLMKALETHYGDTSSPSKVGQELRRKSKYTRRAIRDMTLLAQSLPSEVFAEVFATDDFVNLVRSVLGIGAVDEQKKWIQKRIMALRQSIRDMQQNYRDSMTVIEKEYEYIQNMPAGAEYSRLYEERRQKQANLGTEYTKDDAAAKATIKEAETTIAAIDIPFDPLKTAIAANLAKSSLECCIGQFKHVQKNPVTLSLYEEPINKAATLTDVIVKDVKDNVEHAKQVQELEALKAKQAARKKKRKAR